MNKCQALIREWQMSKENRIRWITRKLFHTSLHGIHITLSCNIHKQSNSTIVLPLSLVSSIMSVLTYRRNILACGEQINCRLPYKSTAISQTVQGRDDIIPFFVVCYPLQVENQCQDAVCLHILIFLSFRYMITSCFSLYNYTVLILKFLLPLQNDIIMNRGI